MSDAMRAPAIPLGNLEPSTLAGFIVSDFQVAWDAMATCSADFHVGGNFMFARQAFGYLELAARTASSFGTTTYLDAFAQRLVERDPRYFTALPGRVPLPRATDFTLPAIAGIAPERQLLAAMFDMTRHGLAHLYQQTPVDMSDGRQWITAFTGTAPGLRMADAGSAERRRMHLAFRIGPREGRVYLIVCPDVFIADLHWAARLAAIFSQYLAPEYLSRPHRPRNQRAAASLAKTTPPYDFASDALIASLASGGHPQLTWEEEADRTVLEA